MPSPDLTILAFDYGTKRIGVAIGQTITNTSCALSPLRAKEGDPSWQEIENLIRQWQPSVILVGLPLNMDGSEQKITRLAKQFAQQLETKYRVEVICVDERLSTREARSQLFDEGGYKALNETSIDSVAAQLILEQWLKERMV